MTLGNKIFQLRKQKGYSQEELAEKLNISRQSVSLWENDQTVPSIEYLIELSKLFGVTIDEICNNNINLEKTDSDGEEPLCKTTFEFTEKKVNQLIKILQGTPRFILLILVNFIFIGLLFLLENARITVLFLDILSNILIITFYFHSNKRDKELLLKDKKNVQITFYNNYFTSYSKSKNNESKYTVFYNEISNLILSDELIIIVFNRKYLVVDSSSLIESKDIIIEKLKNQSKKVSNRTKINSNSLRTWSLVLFVGCFASILLGAVLWGFVVQNNKYSFVDDTAILYSWVFYIAALIPLTSFIFGVILNKRFKCKKNIIAGAIISVALSLYGSFCFIFKPSFSFDKEYLKSVSTIAQLEFPSEYLLVKNGLSIFDETYVNFTNAEEIEQFEEKTKTSNSWQEVKYLTNDISLQILQRVSTYDIFLMYDITNKENLDNIIYNKLLFAYDYDENVLIIYEIVVQTNNNN